jgi:hypothetical protein
MQIFGQNQKCLTGTNSPSYYSGASMEKKKSFVAPTADKVIHLCAQTVWIFGALKQLSFVTNALPNKQECLSLSSIFSQV